MRLRTVSVLAVFAAVLLFGVTPALAANEIAYQCDADICLLDPANPGAVTNLTDNGPTSYDQTPIWSPDGKKVAFVSDFGQPSHGKWNIFVMEPGAAGQAVNLATQITHYGAEKQIEELAWSPDGSRIAYMRGNNIGDETIWVVNADGTTTFPLQIGPVGSKHPTWSPDSSKIAYAVVKGVAQPQIYLAPSTGASGQPLANGVGHEPNWSPDGSRIAFDGANSVSFVDLHVVNADGSGTPLIVPGGNTQWTFNAWSPDSGRIAYRSTIAGGASIYRVMNADGSGDHPLASPGEGDARSASWSPDGSRIVYEGTVLPATSADNLYIANTDGSGTAQPLTSDGKSKSPAWRVVRNTAQAPPPHPGAEKPKVVWFTKRIPWSPGAPLYVAKVFCNAPTCSVSTAGKMKGSMAAGITFFQPQGSAARAKPKGKKPKLIVVGRSTTKILGGKSRKIGFRFNKTGAAVLLKRGKATIKVTITTKSAGQAKKVTNSHTIHVYLKKAKKPKH